jgi:hypothetical protein
MAPPPRRPASQVLVDESHVTGESDDVRKSAKDTPVLISGSKAGVSTRLHSSPLP